MKWIPICIVCLCLGMPTARAQKIIYELDAKTHCTLYSDSKEQECGDWIPVKEELIYYMKYKRFDFKSTGVGVYIETTRSAASGATQYFSDANVLSGDKALIIVNQNAGTVTYCMHYNPSRPTNKIVVYRIRSVSD